MGLTLAFDDAFGMTHTEGYWRIVQFNIDISRLSGQMVIHGYHNKSARDSDKQNIDSRTYIFGEDEYKAYFEVPILNEINVNYIANSYELIKRRKDTLKSGYIRDGAVFKDADGNIVDIDSAMESYFANAVDN